jgi:hypothetical protein
VTTEELIDKLLLHSLEIDPTDGENAHLRERCLLRLQETFNEVWNHRNWWWKKTEDDVLVPADEWGAPLPDNFARISLDGGVYRRVDAQSGLTIKLNEVTRHELVLMQERNETTSAPEFYSIYGTDGTPAVPNINIPRNPVAITLHIFYDIKRPQLIDIDDDTNGLDAIPAQYHEDVLQPGAIRLIRMDQENWPAVQAYDAAFKNGLRNMATAETAGKERVQRMPRFHGTHRAW